MEYVSGARLGFALCLVLLASVAIALLGAKVDVVAITAVGGIAAVLAAAGLGGSEPARAAAAAQAGPVQDPHLLQSVIDALTQPVMVIADGRVRCANRAARGLLGGHIVDQDVRLAIRHPAAAERLLDPQPVPGGPVQLVGLGHRDQRWEMRASDIGDGRRVVQLVDLTSVHASDKIRVDFVANASHELRTPLASLLGFIETLQDEAGEDPGVRQRFLKVMFDEAQRMQRLIDDLMSLSRIEATKYREPDTQVDLAGLIVEARDALASTAGARGADIQLALQFAGPVRGDRAQLSQILFNIIGNALKYGRPGTPVTVTLEPAGSMAKLTVADQGEGIAPEHLPRLTERFYRIDSGRSRAMGGTGLGLAIVKHVVERHRGRLDIASTPGVGSTVTVLLPFEGAVIKR